MQFPKIDKVIVAVWIWSLATRKWMKDFSEIEKNLHTITWQKNHMILSKKAISNFKLREGMPSMVKTTLRRQKAYDFLFKLANIVFPRVRDFAGMTDMSFDKNGWYTIWLKSYSLFPELHPDNISIDVWLQITITTNVQNKEHVKALLQWCGFVFKVA